MTSCDLAAEWAVFSPFNHHDPFSLPPSDLPCSQEVLFDEYMEGRKQLLKTIPKLFGHKWGSLRHLHHRVESCLGIHSADAQQSFVACPVHTGGLIREQNDVWRCRRGDHRGGVLVGKLPMKISNSGHLFKVEVLQVHEGSGAHGSIIAFDKSKPGQEGIWLGCTTDPGISNLFHPQTVPNPFVSPNERLDAQVSSHHQHWWMSTDVNISTRGGWSCYLPCTRGRGLYLHERKPVQLPPAQVGDTYTFSVSKSGELVLLFNGETVGFAPARVANCGNLYPLIKLWGRVTKLRVSV